MAAKKSIAKYHALRWIPFFQNCGGDFNSSQLRRLSAAKNPPFPLGEGGALTRLCGIFCLMVLEDHLDNAALEKNHSAGSRKYSFGEHIAQVIG